MNEIAELLKQLSAKLTAYVAPGTADADKRSREVLDSIRTGHHDVLWQPIANVGFAAGRTSRDTEVTELTGRATAAETEKTRLTGQVAELSDKNKDVAAVQREAATRIEAAESKVKEIQATSKTAVERAVRDRDMTTFESLLIAKGLHPEIAKAQGILLKEKMQYDKDGVLTVMQDGDGNIPYTVHGTELLKVLADTTTKRLPASMFVSRVDSGGDATGDSGSGSGGSGSGDVYKDIQAQEKKRAEEKAPVDVAGAYRVGGRFTGAASAGTR